MASSGTWNFALSNASIVLEAFDRIQIEPPAISTHQMWSARNSLNLELVVSWGNAGFNFWELASGTIDLTAGLGVYPLPANIVTVTDVWFSQVNAFGPGSNNDRLLTPMSRGEFAAISNKNVSGQPNRYWYEMLATPLLNVWQPPVVGAPSCVINWYGLRQVQDANLPGGETPDVATRAIDALCAGLTRRLAEKFKPDQLAAKTAIFNDAWDLLVRRDQEPGNMQFRADTSSYTRMVR